MTAASPLETAPPIPVRKISMQFAADIPRHWLAGGALETHFFNGLNLVFPDGERFFIRAVRAHLGQVEDPALRRQVKGFFGQEAIHAREHERYFEILEAQGYEIHRFLRRFHRFAAWTTRWVPARLQLAMTAGAEHYTATLGAFALEDRLLSQAHPDMRRLILWHAAEEIEHKAVAFDVLRATHPSHILRVVGFVLATVILLGWASVGQRMLLRQDGIGRRERRELRRAIEQRPEHGVVARRLRTSLGAYLRRDFHPNQVDDLAAARARRVEIGLDPGPDRAVEGEEAVRAPEGLRSRPAAAASA